MIPVTFPTRVAASPLPERPSPPPGDQGTGGFEALFASLQPDKPAPDSGNPVAADPAGPDGTLPEATEPVPTIDREPEVPGDVLAGSVSVVLPAALPPPLPVMPLSATEAAAPATGSMQVATGTPIHSQPAERGLAAATWNGDMTSADAPVPLPVTPDAATGQAEAASFQPPANREVVPLDLSAAKEPAAETGLFILSEEAAATPARPAAPTGMPSFWAARAAADGETRNEQVLPPPASQPQAQPPVAAAHAAAVAKAGAEGALAQPADPAIRPDAASTPSDARPTSAPILPQALPVTAAPMFPIQSAQPAPTSFIPTSPVLPAQLPAQITAALAERQERPVEVRLAPVELGGLTVNLRNDGDMLRVTLHADRPDTLELLRRNGDVLLHELRLAGFDGASLSFAGQGGERDRQATAARPQTQANTLQGVPSLAPAAASAQAGQGLDLRL